MLGVMTVLLLFENASETPRSHAQVQADEVS